jgi:hypothetical protein
LDAVFDIQFQGKGHIPEKTRKPAFERQKSAKKCSIQRNLLQQNCTTIIKQFYSEKTFGLIDFSGKYCQFSVPTQHENLDVSANGTQRLRYCPAC